MHDGGVVAVKFTADFRQRTRSQLFGQIHGDLPRPGNRAGTAGRLHFLDRNVKVFGHFFLDFVNRGAAVIRTEHVF